MDETVAVPGRDFIGVGVGALVFDDAGRVFMAQRGHGARNEAGSWEFPGGSVAFGELLQDAVCREFFEEYGIRIEVTGFLGMFDHILPQENQHWVSGTYLAHHLSGSPTIREPDKCDAIGWFGLDKLPEPLSDITRLNLEAYERMGHDDQR
ncbi:NUDIX domain-containing protein [Streptomyces sp. NPDC048045]|uniref:NUDIX domain-containing protein n=1 Tax=Streptomyces sp. NPDC048045 TaxID=3154710 RepID=UPI003425CA30